MAKTTFTLPPLKESLGADDDATAARAEYSKAEWTALKRGEIVIGEAKSGDDQDRMMHAGVIIKHSPQAVWAVLGDFEKRPDFLPGAKEIRVVKTDGNRVWLDERLQFLFVTIRYRVINTLDSVHGMMSWTLDKHAPHDIAETDGSYRLTAIDEGKHTLVRYNVHVVTGRAVPGFLETYLMKRSLPDLLNGLRDEVGRRES